MFKTLCVLVSLSVSPPAFAFYCGKRIISEGMQKSKVLQYCGEASHEDSRTDYYTIKDRQGNEITHTIQIDEWTYDFGNNSFRRILLFKNGKLFQINTDGRGGS